MHKQAWHGLKHVAQSGRAEAFDIVVSYHVDGAAGAGDVERPARRGHHDGRQRRDGLLRDDDRRCQGKNTSKDHARAARIRAGHETSTRPTDGSRVEPRIGRSPGSRVVAVLPAFPEPRLQ